MIPVRSKEDFLVFGKPKFEQAEIDEMVDCLKSGWVGTGPRVARFEKEFAAYVGGDRHPVALFSATAALHLSLLAAGIGPGDEVITTPMTFCATANAIIHTGATPILADVDPITQNIDPAAIEAKITSRTRAILPVHFAGRICDMDRICALASKHGLIIIEDCAHAIETTLHGKKAGTFGEFSCYSFYATKNLASGEGGMVLAKDAESSARVKMLGLHGMSRDAWKRFSSEGYRHYQVVEIGFKYNMMDLQAALAIHQLARLESNWKIREQIWQQYNEALSSLPLILPAEPEPDTRHAYHLYTIRVDPMVAGMDRDTFLTRMTSQNIGVGVHYQALPEHPVYQERYGWRPEDTPHATQIGRETVSLSITPSLQPSDIDDIVTAVTRALDHKTIH